MKLHKLILMAVAGSLLFVSCSSDDDNKDVPSGAYDNGVLVLNEGGFGKGNASVSFLSDAMEVENNIYENVNDELLGDTGQDIGFEGELAYIVVNVSNKIEVVNRYTFVNVGTISTGLTNPRYIAFENGKAYVTCWGNGAVATDDYVAVIDLASNTVSSTIPVAEGPENIVEENGKLYVAHAGGWSQGNTVSVINTANNTVTATINVGTVPNSLEVENGSLYVMSSGMPSWTGSETAGQIDVISLANNTVTRTLAFADNTHPSNLVIEDNKVYYTVGNAVYIMAPTATALPSSALFSATAEGLYSLAVNDGRIYVADAGTFEADGKVLIFSTAGTLQNTLTVGVGPSGFYFND